MQIDPKLSCTLYSELGVHFVRNIQYGFQPVYTFIRFAVAMNYFNDVETK